MTEKVKTWCRREYNDVIFHRSDIEKAIDRCYGIVMFTINEIFESGSPEIKELCDWWDNYMLEKFRKAQKYLYEKSKKRRGELI